MRDGKCFGIAFSVGLWIGALGMAGCSSSEELCGNGKIDPGEQCDGNLLKETSCESLGFGGGVLACDSYCIFDRSGCEEAEPPEDPILRYCALSVMCSSAEEEGMGLGFCVLLESLYRDRFLESRTTITRAQVPMENCRQQAENCEQWRACSAVSESQAALCEEQSTMNFCDGDQLITCYVEPDQAIDCAASGLACMDFENGSASCAIEACDPETTEPVCDGSAIIECHSGLLLVDDCAYSGGMTCVEVEGVPTCVGSGLECGSNFQKHCEGSVAVTCNSGYLSETDCGSLHPDVTCRMANGWPNCVPEASVCDSSTYAESCLDGVIRFCNMGKIDYLDCQEFGGSDCSLGDWVGRDVARCLP